MSAPLAPTPYWWEAAPPPEPVHAPVAETCDVAVVGAGYTGLSAARLLAEKGLSVQVFDRQRAGEGASSRNGGILSGNLRMSVGAAIHRFGFERARAIFREGVAAREYLARTIRDNAIDCDFQMNGRFTGALNIEDFDAMKREVELLNDVVGIAAEGVEKADLPGETGSRAYSGGMIRPDIGTFHPAKFLSGRLGLATKAGAAVHGETAVSGIERAGRRFDVATARGTTRAAHVVMATNGYTDAADRWLRRRLVPVTSRIVVTEEISGNLMNHLIPRRRAMGEHRHLYRYYRPTPDGKRILLGGREPPLVRDPMAAVEHVRRGLVEIFPELDGMAITHSWNGYVAFSREELPHIFERDGIHYACGYCGSGTVWAHWLGTKVAMRILKRSDGRSALDTGAPRAIPLYEGRPWFLPAAMAWYGLKDRRRERRPR